MLFSNFEKFTYELGELKSVYDAGRLMIQKMSGREKWKCVLSIEPDCFELVLGRAFKRSKKYSNDYGQVHFMLEDALMKLDFIHIKRVSHSPMHGSYKEARLKLQVSDNDCQWEESSDTFVIYPRLSISQEISISSRKNKKSLKMREPAGLMLIGYDFEALIAGVILNNSIRMDNEEELLSGHFGINANGDQSKDEDLFLVEEETGSSEEKAVKIIELDSTLIWIYNCVDFDDKTLERRGWSLHNVTQINHALGELCHCRIIGLSNGTKQDLLTKIKEFVIHLRDKEGQVMMIIMSHGDASGFCTKDGFVSMEEFRHHIMDIITNASIADIVVHSYCQEIESTRPHFYEAVCSLGSSDGSSEFSSQLDTNIIATRAHKDDAIHSPESSAENDQLSSPVDQNIIRSINQGSDLPQGVNPDFNHVNIKAALPGQFSLVGKEGSYFPKEIMDETQRHKERSADDRIDGMEVINTAISNMRKMKFRHKSGRQMLQSPQCEGSLKAVFWLG